MKSDDLDLLRGTAPEDDHMPPLFTAPEREALFAAAITGAHGTRRPPGQRQVRTWAYRLAPVAAVAAAAAAVIASGGATGPAAHRPVTPGAAEPSRTAAHPQPSAAPQVRTAGYIRRRAAAAIAAQDHGTLRSFTMYPDGTTREIQDLATGASRYTYTDLNGAVQEDDSFTGIDDTGSTATIIDYAARAWWTSSNEGGGDLTDASGPSVHQMLSGGALAIAGHGTVDGQSAIHLRYTSRTFTVAGKQYMTDTSDIWVNATSFLPIRETGWAGKWTARLVWSARPPTPAQITAVPPAGFTHTPGPVSQPVPAGGGLG